MINEERILFDQERAEQVEEYRADQADRITALVLAGHAVDGVTLEKAVDAFFQNVEEQEVFAMARLLKKYIVKDEAIQAMLEGYVGLAARAAVDENESGEII